MFEDKPPLLILGPELAIHEALFDEKPLTIVDIYLQCFDKKGRQVRRVPEHVLVALAKRFLAFMEGGVPTLDKAFGGAATRQRNSLRASDSDWEVLWTYQAHLEKIKSVPRSERARGTPSNLAAIEAANDLGMSPDNVRRILKKSGRGTRSSNRVL
jgi:hypothetical protein